MTEESEDEAGTQSESEGGGKELPPIHRIREPKMAHTSTRIRWYLALGYTVKEVSNYLGVRYQQVRNVKVTEPKRCAREDVPELRVETYDLETDLEAMESHALEQQMAAQRAADRAARVSTNAARRRLRDGGDGDGGMDEESPE